MRNILNNIRQFFTEIQHPILGFNEAVDLAVKFRQHVEKTLCPACEQRTLQVRTFSAGPKGWEAAIECKNCDYSGAVNSIGFSFAGLNHKGKSKTK